MPSPLVHRLQDRVRGTQVQWEGLQETLCRMPEEKRAVREHQKFLGKCQKEEKMQSMSCLNYYLTSMTHLGTNHDDGTGRDRKSDCQAIWCIYQPCRRC